MPVTLDNDMMQKVEDIGIGEEKVGALTAPTIISETTRLIIEQHKKRMEVCGNKYSIWYLEKKTWALNFGQILLDEINLKISMMNSTKPKGEKGIPMMNKLPAYAIAEIILATGDVQLYKSTASDSGHEIIYKYYYPDGKFSGISKIITMSKRNNANIIAHIARNISVDISKTDVDNVICHVEAALVGHDDSEDEIDEYGNVVSLGTSGKNPYVTYGNSNYKLVCCNNGIYDMETHEFTPHDDPNRWVKYPDTVFLNKLDTDFIQNPQMPVFTNPDGTQWTPDGFLESLFNNSTDVGKASIKLLYEIIQFGVRGYSGTSGNIIMLINAAECANGQNGKSTFMSLLSCMIDNTSVPEWMANNTVPANRVANGIKVPHVPINKWSENFVLASMIKSAMLLISDETDGKPLDGADFLKNAARHQPIAFNAKFKDPFIFTIMNLIIHAQNEFPKFKNKDGASFEHIIMLMMDQDFSVNGKGNKLVKSKYVVDKRVHEYLLWKVLTQMPPLDDFTPEYVATVRCNIEQTKKENIPVHKFLDEVIPMFNLERIPLQWLFEIYDKSWRLRYGETYTCRFDTFKTYVRSYIHGHDELVYNDGRGTFKADDCENIMRATHPVLEEYGTYNGLPIASFGEVEYNAHNATRFMRKIKNEYAGKGNSRYQFKSGYIERKDFEQLKDPKVESIVG